jgi:hypothetical protein
MLLYLQYVKVIVEGWNRGESAKGVCQTPVTDHWMTARGKATIRAGVCLQSWNGTEVLDWVCWPAMAVHIEGRAVDTKFHAGMG